MTQSENNYEFAGPGVGNSIHGTPISGPVNMKPKTNEVMSTRPIDTANALVAGYIVQRAALDPQRIELAGDASETWRGVLEVDQLVSYVSLTYDHSQPLTYVSKGEIRLYAGEPLASDIYYCSDATGRARAWVTGVDADGSRIGSTKSACTAAGEIIEATIVGGG